MGSRHAGRAHLDGLVYWACVLGRVNPNQTKAEGVDPIPSGCIIL